MPEPEPAPAEDVGVAEETPELMQIEGARTLGNDARERLHADGFDDAQIDAWAETFIAEVSSGTVDQFVAWIARQEQGRLSPVPRTRARSRRGSGYGGIGPGRIRTPRTPVSRRRAGAHRDGGDRRADQAQPGVLEGVHCLHPALRS